MKSKTESDHITLFNLGSKPSKYHASTLKLLSKSEIASNTSPT